MGFRNPGFLLAVLNSSIEVRERLVVQFPQRKPGTNGSQVADFSTNIVRLVRCSECGGNRFHCGGRVPANKLLEAQFSRRVWPPPFVTNCFCH